MKALTSKIPLLDAFIHCEIILQSPRYIFQHLHVNSVKLYTIKSANELTIQLDPNILATISFVKVDEATYDLVHTLIPEQLQGQGLGHIFAERVFDHLVTFILKIIQNIKGIS
ncbi:hypothetical protein GWI33_020254 [Rhynchophorus ferrugineus]|uniref:Protein NATD1 n=1 Tax=Rhynchophorus ferrugineus TaxID=354439 RepID=A0A834HRJ5_RHYFE|nr:hypothetical protein GWI33_020254 [Rhynchophorus ferrugineus]